MRLCAEHRGRLLCCDAVIHDQSSSNGNDHILSMARSFVVSNESLKNDLKLGDYKHFVISYLDGENVNVRHLLMQYYDPEVSLVGLRHDWQKISTHDLACDIGLPSMTLEHAWA